MRELGIFNNFQKFQVCGNTISAQISQQNIDRLKSADFGTLIYERTHILHLMRPIRPMTWRLKSRSIFANLIIISPFTLQNVNVFPGKVYILLSKYFNQIHFYRNQVPYFGMYQVNYSSD